MTHDAAKEAASLCDGNTRPAEDRKADEDLHQLQIERDELWNEAEAIRIERDALRAQIKRLTSDEVCMALGQFMNNETVAGSNGGWPAYAKRVITEALRVAGVSL